MNRVGLSVTVLVLLLGCALAGSGARCALAGSGEPALAQQAPPPPPPPPPRPQATNAPPDSIEIINSNAADSTAWSRPDSLPPETESEPGFRTPSDPGSSGSAPREGDWGGSGSNAGTAPGASGSNTGRAGTSTAGGGARGGTGTGTRTGTREIPSTAFGVYAGFPSVAGLQLVLPVDGRAGFRMGLVGFPGVGILWTPGMEIRLTQPPGSTAIDGIYAYSNAFIGEYLLGRDRHWFGLETGLGYRWFLSDRSTRWLAGAELGGHWDSESAWPDKPSLRVFWMIVD